MIPTNAFRLSLILLIATFAKADGIIPDDTALDESVSNLTVSFLREPKSLSNTFFERLSEFQHVIKRMDPLLNHTCDVYLYNQDSVLEISKSEIQNAPLSFKIDRNADNPPYSTILSAFFYLKKPYSGQIMCVHAYDSNHVWTLGKLRKTLGAKGYKY